MRRYAVPLVIVGGTGLLVGLVLLWRSINAESATVDVAPRPGAPTVTALPPTASQAPSLATPAPAAPAIRPRPSEAPEARPDITPAAPTLEADTPPPGTRANTKNLDWGITQMRAQVAANEAKVNECLAQAKAAGERPTGNATLTFIAAKKGDKIVIEDTSVDADGTTLQSQPLLDCLHATSKAMTFEGLPREANAVFITRTVSVDSGTLTENKLIKFSYIR